MADKLANDAADEGCMSRQLKVKCDYDLSNDHYENEAQLNAV